MDFAMASNGLYREPFEAAEDHVLQLKLGQIEREYQRGVSKDRRQIMAALPRFYAVFAAPLATANSSIRWWTPFTASVLTYQKRLPDNHRDPPLPRPCE